MNQIRRYQFTVDDFARMGETGIFSSNVRVELIDGEVRLMSPIGARHAGIVNRIVAQLNRRLQGQAILAVQNPVVLSDFTEPQPDIAVLRARDDFYSQAHPTPPDVLLIIEVADTSLEYDRDEKVPHYAQVGIAEVWLVDLVQDVVTQFTRPADSSYREARAWTRGEVMRTSCLAELEIPVDDLFGPRTGA